ncbi:inositol monophosphatase [Mycobacterium kubicae]|uniref:inositol monophosphatase family protein n=1 Tax=Mycobacterium kubicae TaxID=120959 RepID=UPI00163DF6CB|nr:inositol monophosphatase family protein [Mycobacterium kubicae]QNI08987.1 inositol monophosphatase [Mycobacterium kubicae]
MGDRTALELMEVAQRAAEAGAHVAMHWRENAADLPIEQKTGPRDLVSRADRESEDAIVAVLRQMRPDDGILGEEHGAVAGSSEVVWAVDPIDGTTNYLYGRSDWAVSVAALRRRDNCVLAAAIAEPPMGLMTTACQGGGTWSQGRRVSISEQDSLECALIEVNFGRENQRGKAGAMIDALSPHTRDIRRGGSAASALAQVATGRADAAWVPGLQPWDGAAGVLLVSEAGGAVGDLAGPTPPCWPASGDVLASAPNLWAPLQSLIAPLYTEVV